MRYHDLVWFCFAGILFASCRSQTLCAGGDPSCRMEPDLLYLVSPATTSTTASVSCASSSFCYTFFADNSGAGFDGNLGGVSGADAKCAAGKPAGLPGTGTDYKALISVTGQREPSPAIGWIFKANKQYRRQDGVTQIFTSDASGMFSFGVLTNAFYATASTVAWTGVISSGYPWSIASGNNCNEFTDGTNAFQVYAGNNTTGSSALGGGPYNCDRSTVVATYGLICVQQ